MTSNNPLFSGYESNPTSTARASGLGFSTWPGWCARALAFNLQDLLQFLEGFREVCLGPCACHAIQFERLDLAPLSSGIPRINQPTNYQTNPDQPDFNLELKLKLNVMLSHIIKLMCLSLASKGS